MNEVDKVVEDTLKEGTGMCLVDVDYSKIELRALVASSRHANATASALTQESPTARLIAIHPDHFKGYGHSVDLIRGFRNRHRELYDALAELWTIEQDAHNNLREAAAKPTKNKPYYRIKERW